MKQLREISCAIFCAATLLLSGCGPTKPYQAKYEAAWLEVVKSEAWKESFQEQQAKDEFLEANVADDGWLTENEDTSLVTDPFLSNYDSWVKRAYYKIITEAEKADAALSALNELNH